MSRSPFRRTLALCKTHYDTLGVPRDADVATIKQAFRQLSKETHPDLGGCADRFKQIAHAASVLTNARERQVYDRELSNGLGGGLGVAAARAAPGAPSLRPETGWQNFWMPFFRIRNLAAASLVIAVGLSLTTGSSKPEEECIQAWLNPRTGEWELPAPWDPEYRALQPPLEQVPRSQVRRPK